MIDEIEIGDASRVNMMARHADEMKLRVSCYIGVARYFHGLVTGRLGVRF